MQNGITFVSCSTCHLNWCNFGKTHQKWSKIAKMVCKKAYFCHLHKNEWQVAQETDVFVFYIKFLISGHPWHPHCKYVQWKGSGKALFRCNFEKKYKDFLAFLILLKHCFFYQWKKCIFDNYFNVMFTRN